MVERRRYKLLGVRQAPLSVEFSRQEYWDWVAISFCRRAPLPGMDPVSPVCPALAGGFLNTSAT